MLVVASTTRCSGACGAVFPAGSTAGGDREAKPRRTTTKDDLRVPGGWPSGCLDCSPESPRCRVKRVARSCPIDSQQITASCGVGFITTGFFFVVFVGAAGVSGVRVEREGIPTGSVPTSKDTCRQKLELPACFPVGTEWGSR